MKITKILSNILIFLITGLRPILGEAECKYPISCGVFAVEQLESEPFHKAVWAITKRLWSCI